MVGIVAGAKTKGTSLDGVDVGGRLSGNPLFEKIAALGYDGLESWAWANYRATILAFARQAAQRNARPPRLLEVGGGRDPLFRPEEARALGLDVTVNDIDADELARAPAGLGRAHFDISGDVPQAQAGAYDLIFSQMVFEHVAGVEKAWRNVHTLLAEGGVGLAFVPTLYAPPFVANKYMPEAISAPLLRLFFPRRHAGIQPKFPARYEWCFASQRKLEPMLQRAGFRETLVLPFWTHGYFYRLPVLREIDRFVQLLARARDWRGLGTYAYVLVRK